MSNKQAQGIVLVFTQCEPDVASTSEFNDWFDSHYETLSTTPQILSTRRFKATDDQMPEWLGIADVSPPDFNKSSEYAQLRDNMQGVSLPRLSAHHHYIYTILREHTADSTVLPAKYILIVGWSIPAYLDVDFNRWYDEEHMGDVAKIPGFIRGRRYKLLEANSTLLEPEPFPFNHLIVFEWQDDKYWDYIIQAEHSPRTTKMIAESGGLITRRFGLCRDFRLE